jgi:type IV pilus assembly protein PilE
MRERIARQSGFSLIELVIALAIVTILAAIAIPSYQGHVRKARRNEGKVFLHTLMMAQERYYANFNKYSAQSGPGGLAQPDASQPNGYYAVARIDLDGSGQFVRVTLSPQGPQAGDFCGDLALDSTGLFQASGGLADVCG